jgi:hypothetical protein
LNTKYTKYTKKIQEIGNSRFKAMVATPAVTGAIAGFTHQPGASGCSGRGRLATVAQSGWAGIGLLLYHGSSG